MPGVRRTGSTDRLRGERNQLLREVPDGGQSVSRQKLVALAESRLAEDAGGDGGGHQSKTTSIILRVVSVALEVM